MIRLRFSLALLSAVLLPAFPALAQNAAPVVKNAIGDFTVYAEAPIRSIDLTPVFEDPDMTTAVRMTTVFGPIDIALYEKQKPITVANFLRYVDENRYFTTDPTTKQLASSFIHRSVPGFVIQGGGFIGTVNPRDPQHVQVTPVSTLPKIQNEPGISNKRGTLAMAKFGNDPNSATSQWFINLADNAHLINPQNGEDNGLDVQNGGFSVFARVIGGGMNVSDRLAGLPQYNFGPPFDQLPLRSYSGSGLPTPSDLVSLPAIQRIGPVHSPLTFAASSSDAAVAAVAISDANLLVTGKTVGTADITVTATDADGATVSQTFKVTVAPAPGRLVNISTRLQVLTGEQVLIGGFIVRGDVPKRVLIRAIGPSLSTKGIRDPLANPQLELHDSTGAVIATNDDWSQATKQDIMDTGIPPTSARESAILTTLPSNNSGVAYTAIVRGANNSTGTAVVEIYDVDSGPGSAIVNISTRGHVDIPDERVMIGGFFVGGTESKRVIVRALGPSLAAAGVPGTLADPKLELRDGNGTLLEANNDWASSPEAAEIAASGIAPTDSKESAVLKTLVPGAYTGIVRTNTDAGGVGAVEAYQLP